ncbi:hypothetical protein M5689_002894 [Euphorbia peplus]|nr:hypothetical protein M5689_002894 [Euphorbia peplus]
MKVSLNLDEEHLQNPIIKAKVPISILNHPFTSILTTPTHSFSNLSLALSTNFTSGPSLKFTYSPSISSPSNPFSPFSLSLKSGLGLLGSPRDSPLVFSAHFTLSNSNPNSITPSFFLHFKPQVGHFSLRKTSSSPAPPNPIPSSGFETQFVSGLQSDSAVSSDSESGNGSGHLGWQEVKLEPFVGKENDEFSTNRHLVWLGREKAGSLSGVSVKAKTELPINKRVKVNLRWVMNLKENKMPSMTVNKICLERVEEVKEVKEKSNNEKKAADLELMKGMCFWMTRDLEMIEKENRDLKQCLEEMRHGVSTYSVGARKTVMPAASTDVFAEFEQRRNKMNDEGNRKSEVKKPANSASDLESELQRAIKAAAS